MHGFGGSMGIGGIENGCGYIASISGSHYTLTSKLSSPITTCHEEFMTKFWGQHWVVQGTMESSCIFCFA